MIEVLAGWREDINPAWRPVAAGTELAFADIDPSLGLEVWEPVFPPRRGRRFLGAPKGAHVFHAFDGIAPEDVRCVVLGQDPYPDAAFSTGRAFEAGNIRWWRELEKMFSVSVRTYMQLIAAARTGEEGYAASTAAWRRLVDDIETGRVDLEPASLIADRWVRQGVLLLNSALTITRFTVEGDPHQLSGHLPLWRPFIAAVLTHLLRRADPIVFIGFGDQAARALANADIVPEASNPRVLCILRDHPARGNSVLERENPFVLCNRFLSGVGADPITW